MIDAVVRRLSRWMPRPEPAEPEHDGWADSDTSCHSSSYELASGLEVIEHFADTLPAFHQPPGSAQALR